MSASNEGEGVEAVVELGADGAEVHGLLDDLRVLRDVEGDVVCARGETGQLELGGGEGERKRRDDDDSLTGS
jgi:hypothetical protein